MPVERYAFEPGGPKRLIVTSHNGWRNLVVSFDGTNIGKVKERGNLQAGHDLQLPDGSTLSLKLVGNWWKRRLAVARDGQQLYLVPPRPRPRPRPPMRYVFSPAALVKQAATGSYCLGTMYVLVSLGALGFKWPEVISLSFALETLAAGVVFLILGHFIARRSSVALWAAMSLCVIETLQHIIENKGHGFGSYLFPGLLALCWMYQGQRALRQLKRAEAAASPPAS